MSSRFQILLKAIGSHLSGAFPFVLLALSLLFLYKYAATNDELIANNAELQTEISKLKAVTIGDAIPPIDSSDLEGKLSSIRFRDSKKSLIFIYSKFCKFCVEDFPTWNTLIQDLEDQNLKIHALSLEQDAVDSVSLEFAYLRKRVIVAPPNADVRRTYRVLGTPTILLVSPDGIVEWSHLGRLSMHDVATLKAKARGL